MARRAQLLPPGPSRPQFCCASDSDRAGLCVSSISVPVTGTVTVSVRWSMSHLCGSPCQDVAFVTAPDRSGSGGGCAKYDDRPLHARLLHSAAGLHIDPCSLSSWAQEAAERRRKMAQREAEAAKQIKEQQVASAPPVHVVDALSAALCLSLLAEPGPPCSMTTMKGTTNSISCEPRPLVHPH